MAGYTEEETEKLNDLVEEMTPQERDKAVMEAARLLRAEAGMARGQVSEQQVLHCDKA